MITDDDKERIKQEEMYRIEVRSQLDKDKANHSKTTKGEKFWTLINSAVFLWLLSSVALGTISFLYSKWDKQKEREREARETAQKLDNEISNRVGYFVQSQGILLGEGESVGSSPGSDFGIANACLSEEGIKSLDDPNATGYKVNVSLSTRIGICTHYC